MALYKTPKAAINASILALNGVMLVESEYDYGVPVPIELRGDGTNTEITVTARNEFSTYDGSVTVAYIRLALDDLLFLVPDTVQMPVPATTLAFALSFNAIYGTAFTADDIVSEPVVLVDGSGPVTLTAKVGSLGWTGSATFQVEPGRIPLTGLSNRSLPGLNFPDPYQNKPFGWAYSYWRNASLQEPLLGPVLVNNPDWTSIRDALVQLTGDPWVLNGQVKYSLSGATVLHNGPTQAATYSNNDYDRVMVLQLGADCLGFSGRLFLHYNTPPTDV